MTQPAGTDAADVRVTRTFPGPGGWLARAAEAAAYGLLVAFDEPVFAAIRPVLGGISDRVLPGDRFRVLSDFHAVIVAALLIRLLDPPRRRWIPVLLLAAASVGVAGWGMKQVSGRARPDEYYEIRGRSSEPRGSHPLVRTGVPMFEPFERPNSSLPSGDAAGSMALAAAVGTIYPPSRPVFFTLGCLIGIARVKSDRHWPSDAFLGLLVGWHLGGFLTSWFARVLRVGDARDVRSPAGR